MARFFLAFLLLLLLLCLGLDRGLCHNEEGGVAPIGYLKSWGSSLILKNASLRKLMQISNKVKGLPINGGKEAATVLVSPESSPTHKHIGHHRKGHSGKNFRMAPTKSPTPASMSSVPFPPPPFKHTPSPKPMLSPVTVPSSLSTVPKPKTSETVPNPSASPAMFPETSQIKHGTSPWPIYVSVVAGVSFLLAISALVVFCSRASKVVAVKPWATGLSGQLQKAFVTGVPALKRAEVEAACEDFSNIIGSLSECMVYKGTLSSGVEIAVISSKIKSSRDWSKQCESQFRRKIESLSKVNHKNFVNLLGYCEEDRPFTRMMVFEYAPNGTLFEHLHIKESDHLDWVTRLRISMGIAYCLDHMHQLSPPVLLRDLNSSTIHLTDDFAAKVSDNDLWSESKETDSVDGSSSEPETVVFKFGIILLEILSGRLPFSGEDGLIENWASSYLSGERSLTEMVDPSLKSFREGDLDALCEVIKLCINSEPKNRPTMAQVVSRLIEITAMPLTAATPKVSTLWWAELEIISLETAG